MSASNASAIEDRQNNTQSMQAEKLNEPRLGDISPWKVPWNVPANLSSRYRFRLNNEGCSGSHAEDLS